MKRIIKRIMCHPTLQARPPVLVDIGASGDALRNWKLLAPYSISVAFDADTRDFTVGETSGGAWLKRYSINRLVAPHTATETDFYLTHSPYCSSSLPPDTGALVPWAFCRLFDVEHVVKMPVLGLSEALANLGLDRVDWYKTDSQGTDLRLFAALPESMRDRVLVAEFEPGIIDAYRGEDKLHAVLAYMDNRPFWVSFMDIRGSQRLDQEDLEAFDPIRCFDPESFLKTAPGWCEISYLNTFDGDDMTVREYLLGWVFASIMREHGFALHLAKIGASKFDESLFGELQAISRKALSAGYMHFAARFVARVVGKIGRLLTGGR